jgi:hypothetical protein
MKIPSSRNVKAAAAMFMAGAAAPLAKAPITPNKLRGQNGIAA